ncbi:MAG TPA: hypothetical protein VFU99_01160 [Gaiellaceae bacterium]|nr:hypothetical protein [Gaiellaceae bacterium]
MRLHALRHTRPLLVTLGLLLGAVAGTGAGSLAGSAAVQPDLPATAVLDATHLPPLLTLPGEHPELAYEVHCAAGASTSGEDRCLARGTVFARPVGDDGFTAIPLAPRTTNGILQLASAVPDALASHPSGFEYYAVIEAPDVDRSVVLPAGGADAPHVSRRLRAPVEIELGLHRFGRSSPPFARVASAGWGSGTTEVGLEGGRGASPVGASAFDVDPAGSVFLLDQAHRRVLRWDRGRRTPARVPVSVSGTIADLAASADGTLYILESVPQRGRNPLVRRYDEGGRELEAIETAERGASQIRRSPGGPLVLSQPSHHWTPVELDGGPASPAEQLRHGRSERTVPGGSEVVVYRNGSELRAAIVSGTAVTRSWRVTSQTPLGEVQLAEPRGQRLVIVLRVYEESSAEFVVLVLRREGLVQRFALEASDWAETAPLGRFKLVGRSLYRLGSTPAGAFVDRFDLEVQ